MTLVFHIMLLSTRAPLRVGPAWFWLGVGLLVFAYVLGKLILEHRRTKKDD